MEKPRAQTPYARNLLRNYGALEGLKHWQVPNGEKEPKVEDSPDGAEPLSVGLTLDGPVKNWVTSSVYGALSQQVDLLQEGFPEQLLDEMCPPIHASVRYAGREDCGSKFRFKVELQDGTGQELDKKETEIDMTDLKHRGTWQSVEFNFRNYPSGLRYIRVTMGGVDSVRWAGNYGAKFTLPTVRFVFS